MELEKTLLAVNSSLFISPQLCDRVVKAKSP